MSFRAVQTPNNTLLVQNRMGFARFLIGVPFLLMGIYFFIRYFVLGIVEYIKAGQVLALFSVTEILGSLVILLVTSVFLVPGWLICFLRRGVLIDPARNLVAEGRDFLIYKQNRQHALDQFTRVLLISSPVKDTQRNKWLHTAELADPKGNRVLIGGSEKEDEARELGRTVAAILGKPLEEFTEHELQGDPVE